VNVLLITHALNNRLKDYAPFFNVIKTSGEWWHYFDTSWIVVTFYSPQQLAALLYPHMEKPDRLLVIKLQKDYQGWLDEEAWNWLNAKNF
jgi:hypothetical protein